MLVLLLIALSADSHVSARDKSFMRALVNHYYTKMQEQILIHYLPLMRTKRDEVPYTLSDYKTGGGMPNLDRVSLKNQVRVPFEGARAARTGGRMQLHLMQVSEGATSRIWLFPLRSASTEMMQGLGGDRERNSEVSEEHSGGRAIPRAGEGLSGLECRGDTLIGAS